MFVRAILHCSSCIFSGRIKIFIHLLESIQTVIPTADPEIRIGTLHCLPLEPGACHGDSARRQPQIVKGEEKGPAFHISKFDLDDSCSPSDLHFQMYVRHLITFPFSLA